MSLPRKTTLKSLSYRITRHDSIHGKKKAFPVSCEQPALKHVEKVLRYQELPLLRGHIHYASAL